MNKALVLGASGATGRLLVKLLLNKGVQVIALVRKEGSLANIIDSNGRLDIVEAEISTMQDQELAQLLAGCTAVFSCLGHNLTLKGIYGHPRRLVTDAVAKVARAVELVQSDHPIKMVLMNTTGNSNRDIPEKPPFSQRLVVALLRLILPPHVDNEQAADFLRVQIGQDHHKLEWVAVRPDGLIDEEQVSDYEIHTSPIRNPIFDAGQTSRINVANFMSELSLDTDLWNTWKGQMPVIYNRTQV
ncbi:MAG: SDR family oxidoreductase [Gracilimonas sp.]|uniref:NAD(P)-binding oxidoreductase n=1 Tax=Gracilimonas TaxID=649462 RepID=UPI001B0BAF4A|nr:NAD(P)-binding oxidoreductase [Gracilimonas sp.]MBO6586404.1 SDR family oxidoreductase [Gracilimonas sp.]MBO6615061.1 SDR family oxidoreductase [Gracilimonas sp.]